ncbi:MAG: hypothetical protein NVS3B10_25440 [Polyangiales bacterium]
MPPARRSFVLVALLVGCGKNTVGPAFYGDIDTGVPVADGASDARGDGSDGASHDGTVDALADSAPGDARADALVDSTADGADATGLDTEAPDLGPPLDAPTSEGKPTDSTDDHVCDTELAWWAQSARFDPAPGSPEFVAQVNALIGPGDHPITIVDRQDPATLAWTLQTSATLLGGDLAQHFPASNPPGAAVTMTRTAAGFGSGAPQSTAWIRVVDAAAADVWIPLADATTAATYGDGACQTLTGATVTALVPASAASVPLTTKSGATTLGALLGAQTSSAPPGWNIELAFDATKVGVSFK